MPVSAGGIINDHELRVFGLQRSGIHAVINWIIQQSSGPTVFLNDIKSVTGNPFLETDDAHSFAWEASPRRFDLTLERSGHHASKKYLLLGYEDTDLRYLPIDFDRTIHQGVGESRKILNLLIIRDPYNLFASRMGFLNTANRYPMRQFPERAVELWKVHAREALGATSALEPRRVVILYNRWFSDQAYRQELAAELGLEFTDRGIDSVPGVDLPKVEFARFGCGSSFDNQRFHGQAQAMDVNARWKRYRHDRFYRSLFDDGEIRELSKQLFGNIEGVESVWRPVASDFSAQ